MRRDPGVGAGAAVRSERGFALLAVMLVVALLAVVAVEFTFAMRLEASMVRAHKEGLLAMHLAEAGVEQAMREIMVNAPVQGLNEAGQLVFYRAPAPGVVQLTPLPALRRERVPLGPGTFSYRLTDEEARLNVNLARPERLDALLRALDVDKEARDVVSDSLQDWRDANDTHRINGAESDFYLKLPVPYRARNGNLQDVEELIQLRGVTPELYRGAADRPGLGDLATVHGRNVVNINTASKIALQSLGLSEAEISEVEQTRKLAPYAAVPPRFGGRSLAVGSQTFRIEAEGWVGGERRARVLAIVQNRGATPGRTVRLPTPRQPAGAPPAGSSTAAAGAAPTIVVLSWRVMETR